MRTILVIVAAAMMLGGCAQQQRVGNFADLNSTVVQADLVSDATKQLMVLYPPAKTHFDIRQPTTDPFGAGLIERMREKGYAIEESNKTSKTDAPVKGVQLRYVLDRLDAESLYRITLLVGSQSLSRAYVVADGTVTPAGSWTRQE
jgi:hypothetical protein